MATVRLTWSDSNAGAAQEDGFKVYRSVSPINPSSLPAPLVTLGPDLLTYDDLLVPNGLHHYAVSAHKDGVEKVSLENSIFITEVTDPHFADVVLLASFDGADGDTLAIDDSPAGLTLACVGACALADSEPVFGATSLAVNAADETTGYMTLSDSSGFDFGTGDFTIEGWARASFHSATKWRSIIGNFDNAYSLSWSVFITKDTANNLVFRVNGGPTYVTAPVDWNTDEHHFAISRNGSTLRVFVDGVMGAKSTSYAAAIGNASSPVIIGGNGQGADDRLRGHIDELRVTKGVGRYNSDSSFTVPTGPYPKS